MDHEPIERSTPGAVFSPFDPDYDRTRDNPVRGAATCPVVTRSPTVPVTLG